MLHKLEHWSSTHHPRWLVFLRAALGLALFLKGISFMYDSITLELLLTESGLSFSYPLLILLISWVHLLGGFLISIG